jgi:F-type H+-transporting ATPase subunit b
MPRFCSSHLFGILMMLALTAWVASTPLRLSAQETAPAVDAASQASNTAIPSETAKPESKAAPSQEEQNNVFRLEGPMVKWTAKTLNKSPEFAASLFEFINIGIVVLLLGVPLVKVLPKLLRSRGEKVRSDIEQARKETQEANARLSAIEAKLSGLDAEIDKIRGQVEAESRQDEARIKSTISEESARIVAAAEQEIGASAAQARRSLRHFAADLAIDQATKKLKLTAENDRALIAEFLSDASLTGTAAVKGGQK